MTIRFVPIPLAAVAGTMGIWLPFVEQIAARAMADQDVLVANVRSGDVHIAIAWDDERQTAMALAGMRFVLRGKARIAELIWLTGERRKVWTPLFGEFERYLREHQHCAGIRAICRPGWSKLLKPNGYRLTHVTLEKDFAP